MKVLLIPDVHCRHFWKSAVNAWKGQIIFLGDYIDPYPHEWVDEYPDPKNTLLDILNFKDANQDRVTLLLGNHDFHYMHKGYNGSRLNTELFDLLHILYNEDKEFFQISKQIDDVLFTHAGVSNAWLKRHELTIPTQDADLFLNKIYETTPDIFWEMSWIRGGWWDSGSPIWYDIRESNLDETHFQVFGHTQLKEEPLKSGQYICCDCRKPFIFDTETKELNVFNYETYTE